VGRYIAKRLAWTVFVLLGVASASVSESATLSQLAAKSSPVEVDAFLDEARLVARMHHPNVVEIFELLEHHVDRSLVEVPDRDVRS